jgi:hypothetical protein
VAERLVLWHRWNPPRRARAVSPEALAAWRGHVEARLTAAGGERLGAIGGSLAFAFGPQRRGAALAEALELLTEAERRGLEIVLAAAAGTLTQVDGGTYGGTLELVQVLAHRARPGELVVDPRTRALGASELLFARTVSTGAGRPRGVTVDRTAPRRADAAAHIADLRPAPLPPVLRRVQKGIAQALADGRTRTVILRGPVGAGARQLLRALEAELLPGARIRVGEAPGARAPLESLRRVLRQRFGDGQGTRGAVGPGAGDVLARLADGALVPRDELVAAVAAYLGRPGRPPFVILAPLERVDPASLEVLLGVRAQGVSFPLFGRLPVETPLPPALQSLDEPVFEHTLPPMKPRDARVVAEEILGPDTAESVARRVAILGGETVTGVEEAARTLIATGDLVTRGGAFEWRIGPREGARAMGGMALLDEHLELLPAAARPVLELAAVVPEGTPTAVVAAAARHLGVDEEGFEEARRALAAEGLAEDDGHLRPASGALRHRLRAHLRDGGAHHAAVLQALTAEARLDPVVLAAVARLGGDPSRDGALRVAAAAARKAGYEGAARSLEEWIGDARGEDPARPVPDEEDEDIEELDDVDIEDLEEAPSRRPPPTPAAPLAPTAPSFDEAPDATVLSASPPPPRSLAPAAAPEPAATDRGTPSAVEALRRRDPEALEAALETASPSRASRLRALAALREGDPASARRQLPDPAEDRRTALTSALVGLDGGDPFGAFLDALDALTEARRAEDGRGERVALHLLAACLRGLENGSDAVLLEGRAETASTHL